MILSTYPAVRNGVGPTVVWVLTIMIVCLPILVIFPHHSAKQLLLRICV